MENAIRAPIGGRTRMTFRTSALAKFICILMSTHTSGAGRVARCRSKSCSQTKKPSSFKLTGKSSATRGLGAHATAAAIYTKPTKLRLCAKRPLIFEKHICRLLAAVCRTNAAQTFRRQRNFLCFVSVSIRAEQQDICRTVIAQCATLWHTSPNIHSAMPEQIAATPAATALLTGHDRQNTEPVHPTASRFLLSVLPFV